MREIMRKAGAALAVAAVGFTLMNATAAAAEPADREAGISSTVCEVKVKDAYYWYRDGDDWYIVEEVLHRGQKFTEYGWDNGWYWGTVWGREGVTFWMHADNFYYPCGPR